MKLLVPIVFACVLAGCSSPPRAAEKSAPPAEPAVRITQFYPAPPKIGAGEHAELCYSVEGASTVKLSPPVERVWPALSRCFEVKPSVTTQYTLTAADAAGHTVSSSTTLEVGPHRAAPEASGKRMIVEVTVNKMAIQRGEPVVVCFTARGASKVTITPGQAGQTSAEKGCVTDNPSSTTTYRIEATDAAGRSDSERVTVNVH